MKSIRVINYNMGGGIFGPVHEEQVLSKSDTIDPQCSIQSPMYYKDTSFYELQSNLHIASTLKGTPILYFLSEVYVLTTSTG